MSGSRTLRHQSLGARPWCAREMMCPIWPSSHRQHCLIRTYRANDAGARGRRGVVRPTSPPPVPPVAADPHPTAAMADPTSGHPYRASKWGHDKCARHPDVLDAVPAPIARLPDIAGRRWGGHHLDHGSGRGKADDDTDAGEAGNGGERQNRGAEKGKDPSSAHERAPGKLLTSELPTDRGGFASLIAVNKFPLFCASATRPPIPC